MSKDLEFHYVVSYREGFGWYHSADVEDSVMSDGTIYDYDNHEWLFANDDEETLDLAMLSVLNSALRRMNGETNA